ncbi:complement receptor type 1-like [Emydura macquarii macquarii]|uniref:complement receptor type 1-like n=1 Tax=Emydura macquarii macquarii TaxID=1129001 RepID=UPI00352A0368
MVSLNPRKQHYDIATFQLLLAAAFLVAIHSDCDVPPRFSFAELKEEYRHVKIFPADSVVDYNCRPGYVKVLRSVLRCTKYSEWLGNEEFCKAKSCSHPGDPENGRLVILTDLTFGATVNFTCEEGYRLIGSPERKCVLEGSQVAWDRDIPYCQLIPCLPPPEVEHGRHTGLTLEEFNYGTSVTYQCDTVARGQIPFSLVGEASIHCTSRDHVNGEWSGPAPECKAIRCQQPTVNHGKQVTGYSPIYTYRAFVMFECDSRYTLKGSNILQCDENNRWAPQLPVCERSSCDDPPHIPNTFQNSSNSQLFPAGTVVKYDCKRGYELIPGISSAIVTCQKDFTWSEHKDFCQIIKCPYPHVDNGKETLRNGLRKETYVYQDEIRIQCNGGYNFKNSDGRYNSVLTKCEHNGAWHPALPVCEPVCGTPPHINSGQHNPQEKVFPVGTVVTYSCNEGWLLFGEPSIRCIGGDGRPARWQEPAPECKEILCSRPHIENGTYKTDRYTSNPSKYKLGVWVTFKCNLGYKLKGHDRSSCVENDKWHPPLPSCSLGSCSNPPTIEYAERNNPSKFLVGTRVTYSCKPGYTLIPGVSPSVTCLQNFTWSKVPELCQKVRCQKPEIENGKQVPTTESEYTYGSSVEFKCDSDYILKGNASINCEENGKWNPPVPSCIKVRCPKPVVQNGIMVNASDEKMWYNISESLTFICSPGYQLSEHWYLSATDNLNITCSAGGTWTMLPKCKKQSNAPVCKMVRESRKFLRCGVPPEELRTLLEVQKLYLEIQKLKRDLKRRVKSGCNPARTARSPSFSRNSPATRMSLPSGWTLQLLGTLVLMLLPGGALSSCGKPPDIPNAVQKSKVGAVIPAGMAVIYGCWVGYELIPGLTQGRATCLQNFTWAFVPNFCQKVRCPDPDVSNGTQIPALSSGEETYAFGDRVTIECDLGYGIKGSVDGNVQIRCKPDGTWDPAVPVCEPVCAQPPNISHGQLNGWSKTDFVIGSSITYRCERGFALIGKASINCVSGDEDMPTWSEPTPQCEEIQCPVPDISNGSLKSPLPQKYTTGSSVMFECDPGYILRGRDTIHCQDDGKWYPQLPVCDLGSCSYPPTLEYAERSNPREFLVGTRVTYSCRPGYTLIPGVSPSVTCLKNFTWSKIPVLCQKIRCPTPVIENGKQISASKTIYTYANRVVFQCDPGYILKGSEASVCRTDGGWLPPVPFCDKTCGRPPNIISGKHNGGLKEYFSYGSQVTYTCGEGLSLIGESSIYCTSDGVNLTWSTPAPQCKVVRCPKPEITNGRMTTQIRAFTHGVAVGFSCKAGYLLHGSNESQCQADNTWNPPVPSCRLIQCPKPDVQNGRLVSALNEKMWYDINESITFKCSPGYQFSDHWYLPTMENFSVTCSANGNWTAVPKCKKQSNSEVCAGVRESKDILLCDVPLTELKTLLELKKLFLEIQKLKKEIKKLQ